VVQNSWDLRYCDVALLESHGFYELVAVHNGLNLRAHLMGFEPQRCDGREVVLTG
jgi:hypothetical protein